VPDEPTEPTEPVDIDETEDDNEPPTERELLIALVIQALDEPEEFGPDDVFELLVETGRDDIREEAEEIRAIEAFEEDDDPELEDPEPEPESIAFTEQNPDEG
jgi:hypothetical protein